MSSAETATTKPCSVCVDNPMAMMNNNNNNNNNGEGNHTQVEGLKQEVTRLKCDKLDLLRQNVVSWTEEEEVEWRQEINCICFAELPKRH